MISSKELFKVVFLGSNKNIRADNTLARKVVVILRDNILQKNLDFCVSSKLKKILLGNRKCHELNRAK